MWNPIWVPGCLVRGEGEMWDRGPRLLFKYCSEYDAAAGVLARAKIPLCCCHQYQTWDEKQGRKPRCIKSGSLPDVAPSKIPLWNSGLFDWTWFNFLPHRLNIPTGINKPPAYLIWSDPPPCVWCLLFSLIQYSLLLTTTLTTCLPESWCFFLSFTHSLTHSIICSYSFIV